MKKGQQAELTRMSDFLVKHDGRVTAGYYNNLWHATIMWDDGHKGQYYEAEGNYLTQVLRKVWLKAEKMQESVANSRT